METICYSTANQYITYFFVVVAVAKLISLTFIDPLWIAANEKNTDIAPICERNSVTQKKNTFRPESVEINQWQLATRLYWPTNPSPKYSMPRSNTWFAGESTNNKKISL